MKNKNTILTRVARLEEEAYFRNIAAIVQWVVISMIGVALVVHLVK